MWFHGDLMDICCESIFLITRNLGSEQYPFCVFQTILHLLVWQQNILQEKYILNIQPETMSLYEAQGLSKAVYIECWVLTQWSYYSLALSRRYGDNPKMTCVFCLCIYVAEYLLFSNVSNWIRRYISGCIYPLRAISIWSIYTDNNEN